MPMFGSMSGVWQAIVSAPTNIHVMMTLSKVGFAASVAQAFLNGASGTKTKRLTSFWGAASVVGFTGSSSAFSSPPGASFLPFLNAAVTLSIVFMRTKGEGPSLAESSSLSSKFFSRIARNMFITKNARIMIVRSM